MVERASAEVAATAPSHIIQNWSKDNQRNQQEVRTICRSFLTSEWAPAAMVLVQMVLGRAPASEEMASEKIQFHLCGRVASHFW